MRVDVIITDIPGTKERFTVDFTIDNQLLMMCQGDKVEWIEFESLPYRDLIRDELRKVLDR